LRNDLSFNLPYCNFKVLTYPQNFRNYFQASILRNQEVSALYLMMTFLKDYPLFTKSASLINEILLKSYEFENIWKSFHFFLREYLI
jgi:hypothetical protein